MNRLPSLTAKEVIRKLRKAGFVFDRQAKGSHEIWRNPITKRRTTIPNHP
jgi:predicted RNA binding protein YcfA (HicA-like mRNA interferase family)